MSKWTDRISINERGKLTIAALDPATKALGESIKLEASTEARLKLIDRRLALMDQWVYMDQPEKDEYGSLKQFIGQSMGD
ncbi:hypothetical protein [Paratractidigestivibacter sp.]|uniref:hypothetical protein n=1 Tax=Paratractidigestivibacter sp. TaxID=2847316 RepID=UPI002AC97E49|nr:hypothetical protein [Paratractidigestivibacter sp.]